MKDMKFNELCLKDSVINAINDMGFEIPSEIQRESIPFVMEGFDIIAQAQTGTGKTTAFGAPLISKINPEDKRVQAIVLAPTRELAIQVNDELHRLSKYTNITCLPIYGGQSIDRQISSLKRGASIIVGTPGRVLDHIRRKTLKLSDVKYLVLDEADEMLNMGFIDDIEEIINHMENDRQTLLFSATMPKPIEKLAKKYLKPDIKHITIAKKSMTVSKIKQYYFETKDSNRLEVLRRIIDLDSPESAIIFCRTKRGVDELVSSMQSKGYVIEGMHGDMNQNQRMNTLNKFKRKNLNFLAATDVAARGIDVENVTHVINYDLPQDTESYVHRIGRTGRANKEGTAYSIITRREFVRLRQIEKDTKARIEKKDIPSIEAILEKKSEVIVDNILESLQNNDYKKFLPMVSELEKNHNLADIAAVLIKNLYDKEVNIEYTDDISSGEKTTRLFFSVGRKDRINPKLLLKFIDETSGVNSNSIGDIDILDKFSFVDVPESCVSKIIERSSGKKLNNVKVNIEISKGKSSRRIG